mmetsp:Transcript_85999/g.216472  ORF Transcript_85999/g.216472 Transcript_85999/m.216472 type:complete len:480 (-) Transcript_85999:142-1581(-)
MAQEFKLHEAFTEPGAEEYKKKGNEAFINKNWDEAIKNYNKAIQLDPKQASFYSNRAACWSSKGNHESALADAKKCLEADPTFVKGYSRKGKALFDLGKLDEAEAAYQEGLAQGPANPGCETGLADVRKAKEQTRRSASMFSGFGGGGGGAAGGGAGGGIAGLGKKFMETMKKGGLGGRMQMYGVVMIGYFMYNNFAKGSSKRSEASSHDTADDYGGDDDTVSSPPGGAAPQRARRGFAQVADSWVSYLESGTRGDNLMLLLHSTSSSAEVEFGSALPQILERSSPLPPGGFRLLAPDRPCHGFSPCPASGKAAPGWLDSLLDAKKAKFKRLTLITSGRSAAQQALAVARERPQPSRLLLVDPRSSSPSAPTAAEVHKWLQQHSSATAIADAARWAANAAISEDAEAEDDDKLIATGLPEGSRVTLLYSEGAKEDVDLQEEIEGIGLPVRTRRSEGGLDGALAEEAWKMLSAEDSDVEE